MTPRLTSAVLVSALVRRVANEGGSAAVLARGDATAGAVVLVTLERGVATGLFERVLTSDERYEWVKVGPDLDCASQIWLDRRRAQDPDLWVIELDIANAERFAAETIGDR